MPGTDKPRHRNREKQRLCCSLYQEKNRDAIRAKKKEYYLVRRDELLDYAKKWNANNTERRRHNNQKWEKENPEKSRTRNRNRYARKISAEGTHTADEIEALIKSQKFRCAESACRRSIRKIWHADHIMPLSLGGSNWISNIQLLCPECNLRKSAKDPIVWARENGRLL